MGDLRTRFPLTDEQREIVSEAAALEAGNLKVVAGAGTGKTSTSVAIAESRVRSGSRVLYLAYNKPIRDEAKQKFGALAEVYTVHGIAHKGVGVRHLKRRLGSLYPSHIAPLLNAGSDCGVTRTQLARVVLQTITSFLYSPTLHVEAQHIPAVAQKRGPEFQALVIEQANLAFSQITPDARTEAIPLPHDVYLKYWHLIGSPGLENFDLVLMDEAQDSNGVTIAALANCPAVVWIGDSHQQIYAFRGAVDAMARVKGDELPLTQSFRYGEAIASLANAVLAGKRVKPQFRLKGLASRETMIGGISPREPHTRLYRTNVELLKDAMFYLDQGERIAIVGDQSDLQARLDSAWRLRKGEHRGIRHPLISMFSDWESLEDYSETANDPELSQVVRIIEQHSDRLDEVMALVGREWDERKARVVFTTAHRAKGREWENIVIAPDFDNLLLGGRDLSPAARDSELNLLYVAVTRSMGRLEVQSEYLRHLCPTGA